jgi:hypothetical protein
MICIVQGNVHDQESVHQCAAVVKDAIGRFIYNTSNMHNSRGIKDCNTILCMIRPGSDHSSNSSLIYTRIYFLI